MDQTNIQQSKYQICDICPFLSVKKVLQQKCFRNRKQRNPGKEFDRTSAQKKQQKKKLFTITLSKRKQVKQSAHYQVCLLEEVCCMQEKDLIKKKKKIILKKKKKLSVQDQRGDRSVISKSQAAVKAAPSKVTPIHPQRRQTASRSDQVQPQLIPWQANKQTNKLGQRVSEATCLFFILTLLQRRCLKFPFHPEFLGRCDGDKGGSVTRCSKT